MEGRLVFRHGNAVFSLEIGKRDDGRTHYTLLNECANDVDEPRDLYYVLNEVSMFLQSNLTFSK